MQKKFTPIFSAVIVLLLLSILLGIVARLWNFGSLPLSLNRDEASIAYNALTIAREGVDEWGQSYPFMFRAFGDYKLPGYIYTTAALFWFFEPFELVVRIPSLLAGLASGVLLFLITRQIFPKTRFVAYAAAAAIAVSPWAIFYSRVAFEAHLALALTLAAIWLLLREPRTYWQALMIALLLWLAGLTYNAPLLLTPVIIGSYALLYHKSLLQRKRVTAVLLAAVVLLSLLTASLQYQSYVRKNNTTVFFDPTHAHYFMQARAAASGFWEWVQSNRYTYYGGLVARQYLISIGPHFTLQGGGHPWHTVPGTGHLTMVQYFGAVVGIILWLRSKKKTPAFGFLFLLLLAAPIPSAITVDAPHATRSLTFFALSIIPFTYLLHVLAERKRMWVVMLLLAFLSVEGGIYSWVYHVRYPSTHPDSMQVGLAEAIHSVPPSAQSIVIRDADWSGYVYVALTERMSARTFQETVVYGQQDTVGYDTVLQLGRYTFSTVEGDIPEGSTVLARNPSGVFELRE